MTILLIVLVCSAVIGGGIYFDRQGKLTHVTLLEYQRGVLYRRGLPVREVGCGKHRVWSGTELLVHADTRPISINFENQVVIMQDGNSVLYGVLASAQIQDIRKVIASARTTATSLPRSCSASPACTSTAARKASSPSTKTPSSPK